MNLKLYCKINIKYEVLHIPTENMCVFYLAKSRSASRDMVMLVRFCWRTKIFLHIFLIPDSLMRLKYWAPFIRIQEIRWPRPAPRQEDSQKRKIPSGISFLLRQVVTHPQRYTETCAAGGRLPSLPLWHWCPYSASPPGGRSPCWLH